MRVRDRLARRRDRRVLGRVRRHMAALGHPIDHLSDEDIVAGVLVLGRAANAASMTAAEVEAGLRDALSAWGRGSVTVGGRNPS